MQSEISIQFLGAAGTVTGSKYLLRTPEKTILIDCGLFQGLKKLRLLNWEEFPIEPSTIDLVLLTHGHLDHVGYLARLVKEGFDKPIWGTLPSLEIADIILKDSAKIQEEDAKQANMEGYSKHNPAMPLYDTEDVEETLPLFVAQPLDQWIPISPNISCRFRYNGHIIGATFIELEVFGERWVFSGDIGRTDDLLMFTPQRPEKADYLFLESTYGDRLHPDNAEERLIDIIQTASQTKGTIIIPSFAVERTQLLMYLLWQLRKAGKIPPLPVYMDSPMSTRVLEVFQHHPDWHKLPMEDCAAMCAEMTLVTSFEETHKIAALKFPKIIIAGSGMASGGRVLTYFKKYLGDPTAIIMIVGFQAEGTRGRQLLEGAPEVKLFGKFFPVKAKVENVEGLSAHADQKELLDWASQIVGAPKRVFLTHGEPQAMDVLRTKIEATYGWIAEIPNLNDTFTLG